MIEIIHKQINSESSKTKTENIREKEKRKKKIRTVKYNKIFLKIGEQKCSLFV